MNLPRILGVVLAGGRSTRMGADKATLPIRNQPAVLHQAGLLRSVLPDVVLSIRADQQPALAALAPSPPYPLIPDDPPDQGPLSAILTVARQYPSHALFLLPTDLLDLTPAPLRELLSLRAPRLDAIAACQPGSIPLMPHPLFAIWEPAALDAARAAWTQGIRSPNRVLQQLHHARLRLHPVPFHDRNTP